MSKRIEVGTIFRATFNDGTEVPEEYQPHVVTIIDSYDPLFFQEHQLIGNNRVKPFGGSAHEGNVGKIIGFMDPEALQTALENRLK